MLCCGRDGGAQHALEGTICDTRFKAAIPVIQVEHREEHGCQTSFQNSHDDPTILPVSDVGELSSIESAKRVRKAVQVLEALSSDEIVNALEQVYYDKPTLLRSMRKSLILSNMWSREKEAPEEEPCPEAALPTACPEGLSLQANKTSATRNEANKDGLVAKAQAEAQDEQRIQKKAVKRATQIATGCKPNAVMNSQAAGKSLMISSGSNGSFASSFAAQLSEQKRDSPAQHSDHKFSSSFTQSSQLGAQEGESNAEPPNDFADAHQCCIMQFSTSLYYCKEGDGDEVIIDVVRLGNADEAVSCTFETKEASAKAGVKFKYQKGQCYFAPGQTWHQLSVTVFQDDSWDTTLEFDVELSNPEGPHAMLGKYLHICSVKIIDDDVFPTNKFRETILLQDKTKLEKINIFLLFFEYAKMNMRNPLVNKRTKQILMVDQTQNFFYIWRLLIIKAIVDEVVGSAVDETKCMPGKRIFPFMLPCPEDDATRHILLMIFMVLVIVPLTIPHYFQYKCTFWKVGGTSRKTIQANLMRKFLNYDEVSRHKVSHTDLIVAMTRDTFEVVHNGYMKIFPLVLNFVRLMLLLLLQLAMGSYFATIPVLVSPVILLLFLRVRAKKSMRLSHSQDRLYNEKIAHVGLVLRCFRLIADYHRRPLAVAQFEKRIGAFNWALILADANTVNNTYAATWLSTVTTGVWLVIGGTSVIAGQSDLGVFVTNLEVFSAVGQSWAIIYSIIIQVHNSCPSLQRLVRYMNLPTDMEQRMEISQELLVRGEAARQEERHHIEEGILAGRPSSIHATYAVDNVKIKMEHIKYRYPDTIWDSLSEAHARMSMVVKGGIGNWTFEFPQGKFIVFVGLPEAGKSTLMKILSGDLLPDTGKLLVPPHLRVQNVSMEPLFFKDQSLYTNLTYGTHMDPSDAKSSRVFNICQRLKIPDHILCFLKEGEETFTKVSDWGEMLSQTQKMLLSLARALISNPEVLVCHKPTVVYNDDLTENTLALLLEFCRSKGLDMDPAMINHRRPRTCIITASRAKGVQMADMVFEVTHDGVNTIEESARRTIMGNPENFR